MGKFREYLESLNEADPTNVSINETVWDYGKVLQYLTFNLKEYPKSKESKDVVDYISKNLK